MHGWTGRILKIDLDSKKVSEENPGRGVYEKYIGGKGLAGYYLKDHITKAWNDPEMPLLLFNGPLSGTQSPTSGRMTVMSRSPQTGTVGDTSVGGKFGTRMKNAGWDGIIITGRSGLPCGIEISDDSVGFTDASLLTGKLTGEISSILGEKGSSAVTGPASENGVKFSSVIFDRHYAAGRNGLGLIFAAKNLKYITVKGTGKTEVANPEGLKKAREDILRLAAASPVIMGELGITNYGTAAIYDLMDSRRMMPTDNFRKTHFDHAKEMNAAVYKHKYHPKRYGCMGCHILCKKMTAEGEALPEFETMNHFSSLLLNTDTDTVMEANRLCNEMGMDTISAGATLAAYSEIRGKILSGAEIVRLIADIGLGKGNGKALGAGSFDYAAAMGKPEASITVKKLELPAYDPRGAYGMALGYAVSTRGGCHLRAYPIGSEILRKPVPTDRFSFSGKSMIIKISEDANAVVDSLTACKFIFFGASLEEYANAYSAVTGCETSGQELLRIGERIYYAQRMMNAANGFSSVHDDLPARFFNEDGSSGNGIEINRINRDDFLAARSLYYSVRGLDENGIPLKEMVKELGLT